MTESGIEKRAQRIREQLYRLIVESALTSDQEESASRLVSAIDVNCAKLAEARLKEDILPAAKTDKDEARGALVTATLKAEKLLHELARREDHGRLADAATCLLPFLEDMTDVSRARSYWDLCYGSGRRGSNS